MRRGPKPAKPDVKGKPPVARKSLKKDSATVTDLEKRLAEALKRETEGLTREAEAKAQHAATAEILRVISSSPADVQPVFEAIARNAVRLCGGELGAVFRFDGEFMHVGALHGFSADGEEATRRAFPTRPDRLMLAGRAVLSRATVHVPDVLADPEFDYRALAATAGWRSLLVIPMLRGGEVLGTVGVTRAHVGPFRDQEIGLLQTFADQAVIAIENVRLFTELQEKNEALTRAHAQVTVSLEQQTATSEILRVIASSPTDVQPVFDTILQNATRLCDAQLAALFLFDGESYRAVAFHGVSAALIEYHTQGPIRPGPRTALGRIVHERRPVHIHDVAADAAEGDPVRRAVVELEGMRTLLMVPLLREARLVGAVSVYRRQVHPFTAKQIALVETFADQAVIAIENVRLFNETKEALEQQTATSEILSVISSSPTDVQPVFDAIAAAATTLCAAESTGVFLFDGTLIHFAAHHNWRAKDLAAIRETFPRPPGPGTVTARAILTRAVAHVADIAADPEYAIRGFVEEGFHAILSVPMLRDSDPIGAISVTRREAVPFTDKQVALLQTFADQAVIAIENVRLFKELEARNRDLTRALDQQTATSDILGVISQSQTDVQPVFEAIADSAMQLLRAWAAGVARYDGELVSLVATRGGSPGSADAARELLRPHRPDNPAEEAVLTKRVQHVADIETDPSCSSEFRRYAAARGFRSFVAAPMLRGGDPVGFIAVSRAQPGGFSSDEIALLQTFADQAVIAIENVRLFRELQTSNRDLTTALEQQTATSELLKVIGRSTFELQPVFETLAENAVRFCEAERAFIFRVDGQLLRGVASYNASPEIIAFIERNPATPGRSSATGRAALERRTVHIHDALADPEYTYGSRDVDRFRTIVGIPMLKASELLGVITIYRHDVRPFSDSQIALMETFADQAAIAIENARLLSELRDRTAELTRSVSELKALGEVGRALSSTLDLETVLQTIVARANELAGTAGCSIWEYDEPHAQFRLRASHYADARDAALLQAPGRATLVPRGQGVTTRVMQRREPVQIHDITTARDYESPIRRPLIEAGHRALLGVPLVSEDQIIGVLTVTRKTSGEFEPETVQLLSTFATQSALAIQNARLFREIEDKSRQLEVASQHKSEFLANMSHELRTPLNAIIGFSEVLSERMFGDLNEKQEEYLKDIYASGTHLLSLINDILDLSKIEAGRMELEVTEFDLPTAIDNALMLVRERAGRRSIALHMNIDSQLGLIQADERKVRQVVLNLLSNAIKFTPEGGRIDVGAVPKDGFVEVSVSDTGIGIAPEDQEKVFEEFRQVGTAAKKVEGTGLGLTLCRKFVELHGGRIWVKSQEGVGSTFTFTIPARRG